MNPSFILVTLSDTRSEGQLTSKKRTLWGKAQAPVNPSEVGDINTMISGVDLV